MSNVAANFLEAAWLAFLHASLSLPSLFAWWYALAYSQLRSFLEFLSRVGLTWHNYVQDLLNLFYCPRNINSLCPNDLDLNVSIFQFFVISNAQICEIQWFKPAGFIMFGKFGSYRIGVSTVVSLVVLSRYVAASIARSRNWKTELDHGAGQDKVPVS